MCDQVDAWAETVPAIAHWAACRANKQISGISGRMPALSIHRPFGCRRPGPMPTRQGTSTLRVRVMRLWISGDCSIVDVEGLPAAWDVAEVPPT